MTGILSMMGGMEDKMIYEDILCDSDDLNNNNSSDDGCCGNRFASLCTTCYVFLRSVFLFTQL